MRRKATFGTMALAVAALMINSAMPVAAQVVGPQLASKLKASNSLVTKVQRRRGRRRRRSGRGRGRGRGSGWGPAVGFGIGALFGGLAAGAAANANAVEWCDRRYRSYDRATQTYLGYDGLRHPCP